MDEQIKKQLTGHLEAFRAFRQKLAGQSPAYRWSVSFDGGLHGQHLIIQALTHGNEVGPLPGLLAAMQALEGGDWKFGGRVTFILGNPEAALANTRFLERDLNRVFIPLASGAPERKIHEVGRAHELMPIFDTCDLFLDLHQTSQPSLHHFYTGPWRADWDLWVRALGGSTPWVTRAHGQSFQPGLKCTDEYIRDRGAMGITLELGQNGFNAEATARAKAEIHRAFQILDARAKGVSLADLAGENPPPRYYQLVYMQAFSDPKMALAPGWSNFKGVTEGEVVSAEGTPPICAQASGALLHPIYPQRDGLGAAEEPRAKTLFRVIQSLKASPAEVFAPLGGDSEQMS